MIQNVDMSTEVSTQCACYEVWTLLALKLRVHLRSSSPVPWANIIFWISELKKNCDYLITLMNQTRAINQKFNFKISHVIISMLWCLKCMQRYMNEPIIWAPLWGYKGSQSSKNEQNQLYRLNILKPPFMKKNWTYPNSS